MSGYDQFFKQARQAKRQKLSEPVTKKTEENLRRELKVKPKRRPIGFPWRSTLVLAVICALLGWWSVDPELPDRVLNTIEVRMMGQARAEGHKDAEKATATKTEDKATSTATDSKEKSDAGVSSSPGGAEDLSHLEKLRARKEQLDLREKELGELEEELHKQKAEIDSRIKRLEELRAQIATVLKERIEVDQEKVTKLVETYSNMKPKQAAEILAGVDEDLAVEVLGKMKKKNAAEIMNLLESSKARSISEKFAGYKRR